MPWAKQTYDRTAEVYKEFLPMMFERRNQDMTLVINELLVRAEILKRDFTKRQLTILSYIITLSYQYGKTKALIPKLSDWEIAGIHRSKIKHELTTLVKKNVIEWNEETNEFAIEEPLLWSSDLRYNYGYNDDRSRELFLLNLQHAGIDIQPIIEKMNKMK